MNDTWLITGSSVGLGRSMVEAALAAGHNVVATARDPPHWTISRLDSPTAFSRSGSMLPTRSGPRR